MDNQDSFVDYVKMLTASEIQKDIKDLEDEHVYAGPLLRDRIREEIQVLSLALKVNAFTKSIESIVINK